MAVELMLPEASAMAPLYHKYQGQSQAQPAYLELAPAKGALHADWDGEIGNAVPFDVWHRRVLRFPVANTLTGAQIHDLAGEISPLADRICAGYACEWDGQNHVGRYSEDAEAAIEEAEGLCRDLTGEAKVWAVEDWLGSLGVRDLIAPGQSLEDAAEEIRSYATSEGVYLVGDLDRYLREARDASQRVLTSAKVAFWLHPVTRQAVEQLTLPEGTVVRLLPNRLPDNPDEGYRFEALLVEADGWHVYEAYGQVRSEAAQ